MVAYAKFIVEEGDDIQLDTKTPKVCTLNKILGLEESIENNLCDDFIYNLVLAKSAEVTEVHGKNRLTFATFVKRNVFCSVCATSRCRLVIR